MLESAAHRRGATDQEEIGQQSVRRHLPRKTVVKQNPFVASHAKPSLEKTIITVKATRGHAVWGLRGQSNLQQLLLRPRVHLRYM